MDESVKRIFQVMPRATANYNDMEGEAALSWASHGDGDLGKIAKHQKIDIEKYMIHGISLHFRRLRISLSFYISDKSSGSRDIQRVLTSITQDDLFKFVDDFGVDLYPQFSSVEGYKYIGEVDSDNL
jgi:hypothetical protein